MFPIKKALRKKVRGKLARSCVTLWTRTMSGLRSYLLGGPCMCRSESQVILTFVTMFFAAGFIVFCLYSSTNPTFTSFPKARPWQNIYLRSSLTSSTPTDVTLTTGSGNQTPPILHNVTVVTAFLDIGEFGKGSPHIKRDHHIYERWSTAFAKLQAPVVMYTNSDNFARHFRSVRQHLTPLTQVVKVNVSSLWSFTLKPQITKIYAGGYPKHWPNTVNPGYTCVTHTKFDFLRDVIGRDYFPSRLLAWMDIGYLRNIEGRNESNRYVMRAPPEFNPRQVLCGEVFNPDFNTPWKTILRGNVNWVAGGFFLATRDVMSTFVEQYRRAVLSFLKLRESQVEQQILYAMYTKGGRAIVHPTVELTALRGDWFDVGFKCMHLLNPPAHNGTKPPPIVSANHGRPTKTV